MKDKSPLTIKKDDIEGNALFVCRCGLSADWPFCDNSHKLARQEEEGKVFKYRRTSRDEAAEREEVTEDVSDKDPRPWT